MQILGLVSGLPKRLRDIATVVMLQALFDDTGKSGSDPLFTLAGFCGRARNWAAFSDDWQRMLDRKPKLPYIKGQEAYRLQNKHSHFFGWSAAERDKRLLAAVEIIKKYALYGMTFTIPNVGYKAVFDIISGLPHPNYRAFKNPYLIALLGLSATLLRINASTKTVEKLQILFDNGIDNHKRLDRAYTGFVDVVRRENPEAYNRLVNKSAEFRDDVEVNPLQAADLLAWHVRHHMEAQLNNAKYEEPVWIALRDIELRNHGYNKAQLKSFLNEVILRTVEEVDGH